MTTSLTYCRKTERIFFKFPPVLLQTFAGWVCAELKYLTTDIAETREQSDLGPHWVYKVHVCQK